MRWRTWGLKGGNRRRRFVHSVRIMGWGECGLGTQTHSISIGMQVVYKPLSWAPHLQKGPVGAALPQCSMRKQCGSQTGWRVYEGSNSLHGLTTWTARFGRGLLCHGLGQRKKLSHQEMTQLCHICVAGDGAIARTWTSYTWHGFCPAELTQVPTTIWQYEFGAQNPSWSLGLSFQ